MNTRIKQFMDHKGLTSSELADSIGVQRSNVTHVLHGRNKPSFQFIAKLLETYPEIDAKWLIMGEGDMLTTGTQRQANLFTEQKPSGQELQKEIIEKAIIEPKPEKNITQSSQPFDMPIFNNTANKSIDRIVIFYTDQTFKQYTPAK